jgi:hypothetical protein
MLYIGLFFLLVGVWQAFMRGSLSASISGVALILGMVFVFLSNWHIGLFISFMLTSWFLLMWIYNFSTYYRYFLISSPFLILYAALVAFLLHQYFPSFLWWYLALTAFFITYQFYEATATGDIFLNLTRDNGEENTKAEIKKSVNRTMTYFSMSSILFMVSLPVSLYYFSYKDKGVAGTYSQKTVVRIKNDTDSDLKYFFKSINLKNKATEIGNSGQPYKQLGREKGQKMIEYYRQALVEAKKADIQKLNSVYAGLGENYQKKFIRGIEMFLEGDEKGNTQIFLQGQILLDQFGEWYEKNFNAIDRAIANQ